MAKQRKFWMSFGPRPSTRNWTKHCCTIYPLAIRAKPAKEWRHFSKSAVPVGSPLRGAMPKEFYESLLANGIKPAGQTGIAACIPDRDSIVAAPCQSAVISSRCVMEKQGIENSRKNTEFSLASFLKKALGLVRAYILKKNDWRRLTSCGYAARVTFPSSSPVEQQAL